MFTFYIRRQNELYHHGIKGQKWGIRRFQNEDGSLTAEGKRRYSISDDDEDLAEGQLIKKNKYGNYRYRSPSYTKFFGKQKEIHEVNKRRAEATIKYDASRAQEEIDKTGGYKYGWFENKNRMNPSYSESQLINHYKDKNGNIALSYSNVPNVGDVYVKGIGDINDLVLEDIFKKVPKSVKKMQVKNI